MLWVLMHCGRCGQFILQLLAIMEELSRPAKLLPRPACSRENAGSDCGWALVIAVSTVLLAHLNKSGSLSCFDL